MYLSACINLYSGCIHDNQTSKQKINHSNSLICHYNISNPSYKLSIMSPWIVKETCERSNPAPLGRAIVIRVLAHILGTVQLVGKLPTTALRCFWGASQLPRCRLQVYEWQWFWFEKELQRTTSSEAGAFRFCLTRSPCWLLRLHPCYRNESQLPSGIVMGPTWHN